MPPVTPPTPPSRVKKTSFSHFNAMPGTLLFSVAESGTGGEPIASVAFSENPTTKNLHLAIDRDNLVDIIDAATQALAKMDELSPPTPAP